MSLQVKATTSETQTDLSPSRGQVSDRVRAHDAPQYAAALKRIELVPIYGWDELEPAQLQQRSEWHDPRQPGPPDAIGGGSESGDGHAAGEPGASV
jgi:hypothetical protein